MSDAPTSDRRHRAPRGLQHGLSIVELMVGLVVSLIIGLAATTSAVVFNASQRQGIGVGGAAVNINTAMAALKNDAASAGLGFFSFPNFLCPSMNLSIAAVAHWNGTAFSPVRITRQAGQDQIDVLQATQVLAGATVQLALPSTGQDASLRSFLPATAGDAVLLSNRGSTDPCLLRTVTAAVPAVDETPQRLVFDNAGVHNASAFSTNPLYSDANGGVTLIGQLRWQRYRLEGTDLLLERPLDGTSAVLARQVIALRAQYGVSSTVTTSNTLETWESATGTFATLSTATLSRVRAIRVGVLVRSPQREKPNASGVCEASLTKPVLFGVEVEPDVTDWACYRFRSSVLVIPMRNLVLGMEKS